MRLKEFTEPAVQESPIASSWQVDLTYDRANSAITMVTNKNFRYRISNIPWELYRGWRRSRSKGKYWHKYIKNQYQIDRIL